MKGSGLRVLEFKVWGFRSTVEAVTAPLDRVWNC